MMLQPKSSLLAPSLTDTDIRLGGERVADGAQGAGEIHRARIGIEPRPRQGVVPPLLRNLGEGFDLHQQIGVGRLRHRDDRAVRRRRAEITLPQIGVFVELGGLFNVADGKKDILDRGTSRFEARSDILADLLDLLLQILLPDDISGRVARDLTAHNDPMPAIT
jgi:hypothetical protein